MLICVNVRERALMCTINEKCNANAWTPVVHPPLLIWTCVNLSNRNGLQFVRKLSNLMRGFRKWPEYMATFSQAVGFYFHMKKSQTHIHTSFTIPTGILHTLEHCLNPSPIKIHRNTFRWTYTENKTPNCVIQYANLCQHLCSHRHSFTIYSEIFWCCWQHHARYPPQQYTKKKHWSRCKFRNLKTSFL